MSKLNNGDVTDVLNSFFIDYAIDDDDDEEITNELMQQRSDMNKAVNEWYAKAKAFDEIMKVFENNFSATDSLAKLQVFTEVENAYIESGESDAKK